MKLGARSTPTMFTHRLAWELYRGPLPEEACVLHSCDVPCCVNPAHLRLGTRADNAADAKRRGRAMHGETHYQAKITTRIADEIRGSRERSVVLAARYGISRQSVADIRAGRTWSKL